MKKLKGANAFEEVGAITADDAEPTFAGTITVLNEASRAAS
jgi:hypothetical protein